MIGPEQTVSHNFVIGHRRINRSFFAEEVHALFGQAKGTLQPAASLFTLQCQGKLHVFNGRI